MSGGGREPAEGKEEMDMSVNNLGKEGGESKGVRGFFQEGGAGGTNFWGGDVGDNPRNGPGPGGSQHRVA